MKKNLSWHPIAQHWFQTNKHRAASIGELSRIASREGVVPYGVGTIQCFFNKLSPKTLKLSRNKWQKEVWAWYLNQNGSLDKFSLVSVARAAAILDIGQGIGWHSIYTFLRKKTKKSK